MEVEAGVRDEMMDDSEISCWAVVAADDRVPCAFDICVWAIKSECWAERAGFILVGFAVPERIVWAEANCLSADANISCEFDT